MERGPFIKSHPLFALIRGMPDDVCNGCLGFTYEVFDRYAGIWFKTEAQAWTFRDTMNKQIGWSIISKPDVMDKYSDLNPFTCDVACVLPLPKNIADRNEKYGGDAMKGALAACREAGIEVIM